MRYTADGSFQEKIMIRMYGGQKVPQGFYWHYREWRIHPVREYGEALPGGPEDMYRRLNVFEMLLMALVMGALFVIALPSIGIGAIGGMFFFSVLTFFLQRLGCLFHRRLDRQCGPLCKTNLPIWMVGGSLCGLMVFLAGLFIRSCWMP